MTEPTDAELGKLAEECGIGWGAGLGGMSDLKLPMTDKTDLIREILEYVTTHGGENTATHLLVQAASAIQTQAEELEAVGAGGMQPLRNATPDQVQRPVAYAVFAENGNIRLWSQQPIDTSRAVPLYSAPQPLPAEVLGWICEDELPDGYPYEAMHAHSKVDGVRLFPVFGPNAAPLPELAQPSQQTLRECFEALARDSYNFKRSRRDCYVNPAVARDWKWFRLGANTAAQVRKP